MMRNSLIALLTAMTLLVGNTAAAATPQSTLFAEPWNRGQRADEPSFQVQRIDDNTYAIRQSIKTTFEAPFMYLLFGAEKALLIDSGVVGSDLRAVINRLIAKRAEDQGSSQVELIVMHTHGHADHVGADPEFAARAATTVVGHKASEVAEFFAIEQWPEQSVSFDLGNRLIELLPTPGHHDSHVMVYDRASQILFSGDALYPGRLYFQCAKFDQYRDSIAKLRTWITDRPLSWVLGAHIEMKAKPGKSFDSQKNKRSAEHLLELAPSVIDELHVALAGLGNEPRVLPQTEFIVFPHPADPRGKQPPDWCLDQ